MPLQNRRGVTRRMPREVVVIVTAFLILCLVSLYRQISTRLMANDPVRPIIVYLVYLLLLSVWWGAIRNRITQLSMRNFLLAEHAFMFFGITVRLLQDAFLPYFSKDILSQGEAFLMRLSGYANAVPMIMIPLFGIYATFGLGRTEEYRIHRKWYFLSIPAGLLVLMTITNEYHGLIFQQVEDVQAILYYRPNVGLFIVIAWAFSLLLVRIFLIYHKSRVLSGYTPLRIVPVLIAVVLILYNIPYIAGSFVVSFELIEHTAGLFFFEAIIWETCILSGMVPVNTHYEEVFDRSTVAMQIVDEEGTPYLKSSSASKLSTEMLERLKQQKTVHTTEGQEINLQIIRGGYAVWKNDVSRTLIVIDELKKSVKKLEYDGELLRQELKLRSDTAAVREQNRLYNQLTDEVGEQLMLLDNLLKKREWTTDKSALFRKICLIGTYVKRRCNLRLVEQSDGVISNKELELSYAELIGCLQQMGVKAEVIWKEAKQLAPEHAILTLEVFEFLLEYEDFEPHSIRIVFETDTTFSIQLHRKAGLLVQTSMNHASVEQASVEQASTGQTTKLQDRQGVPIAEIQRILKDNYDISWQLLDGGYHIIISLRGA